VLPLFQTAIYGEGRNDWKPPPPRAADTECRHFMGRSESFAGR
jgi:hypothetical protein